MIWSLLDVCPILQISFSTSLACRVEMWWSGKKCPWIYIHRLFDGPLASLVFPVSLCLIAHSLMLRSEMHELMVSALSLVHFQCFAVADLDPPCTWCPRVSVFRSSRNSQVIFSMDGSTFLCWQSPGYFAICFPWHLDSFQKHVEFQVCAKMHREYISWLKGLCVFLCVCIHMYIYIQYIHIFICTHLYMCV